MIFNFKAVEVFLVAILLQKPQEMMTEESEN